MKNETRDHRKNKNLEAVWKKIYLPKGQRRSRSHIRRQHQRRDPSCRNLWTSPPEVSRANPSPHSRPFRSSFFSDECSGRVSLAKKELRARKQHSHQFSTTFFVFDRGPIFVPLLCSFF